MQNVDHDNKLIITLQTKICELKSLIDYNSEYEEINYISQTTNKYYSVM